MELKDLKSVPLIFLVTSFIFVIAILILDSMVDNNMNVVNIQAYNESFLVPGNQSNFTLVHYRITSIDNVTNSSFNILGVGNYSLVDGNLAKLQLLDNRSTCFTGGYCYISYHYNNYDVGGSKAILSMQTALGEIPSNWLLLIAVALVASVIIGFVVSNMSVDRR